MQILEKEAETVQDITMATAEVHWADVGDPSKVLTYCAQARSLAVALRSQELADVAAEASFRALRAASCVALPLTPLIRVFHNSPTTHHNSPQLLWVSCG